MGARENDRRVQRTQQLLRAALLSLIEEKGFEALTVQEIIDRANVGRATFYAHFDRKEDLLVSELDGLRLALKRAPDTGTLPQWLRRPTLFIQPRDLRAHRGVPKGVSIDGR